jgi:hypothetical protein
VYFFIIIVVRDYYFLFKMFIEVVVVIIDFELIVNLLKKIDFIQLYKIKSDL